MSLVVTAWLMVTSAAFDPPGLSAASLWTAVTVTILVSGASPLASPGRNTTGAAVTADVSPLVGVTVTSLDGARSKVIA